MRSAALGARVETDRRRSIFKRCGVCARAFDVDAWRRLPEVARVSSAEVRPYLSVAADWEIDLRRCTCGALLAARDR